jgi:DNA ligase (NAD+)
VAGAIRNLDPKITEKRRPEIMFYNVNYIEGKEFSTQEESVEFLRENGFKVHPFLRICKDIDSVISAIKEVDQNRKTLDILTDGAVVKLNDMKNDNIFNYFTKYFLNNIEIDYINNNVLKISECFVDRLTRYYKNKVIITYKNI